MERSGRARRPRADHLKAWCARRECEVSSVLDSTRASPGILQRLQNPLARCGRLLCEHARGEQRKRRVGFFELARVTAQCAAVFCNCGVIAARDGTGPGSLRAEPLIIIEHLAN